MILLPIVGGQCVGADAECLTRKPRKAAKSDRFADAAFAVFAGFRVRPWACAKEGGGLVVSLRSLRLCVNQNSHPVIRGTRKRAPYGAEPWFGAEASG